MTRIIIAGAACIAVLVLLAALAWDPGQQQNRPIEETSPANNRVDVAEAKPGFLYGRVTDVDGGIYEGRLRWGRDQEAFWGDYFNGTREKNPWADHATLAKRPGDRDPIEIFGFKIGADPINLARPFMARFGDIARIETHVATVQVTLKSGTAFELNRFAAGDIDDGVRVWDDKRGMADIDARRIRTIEFLPVAARVADAHRLHGTVVTSHGNFTGFVQWDRQDCLGTDELAGRTQDGELRLPYNTIRSIVRQQRDSTLVTLMDGRTLVLSGTREVGPDNRGIYVDDPRYGRVLVSWDAFERVDFDVGDSGPGYAGFLAGHALTGRVATRDGRLRTGRLVFDFDESETTETLDAALRGVDYTIPFSLIAAIVPRDSEGRRGPRATVTLRGGDELQLERTGDLAEGNGGMLIFADGRQQPEYVPWADVMRIDFVAGR